MSVNGTLTFVAQLLFIFLTTVALIDYVRYPNPRRRDFALFCASLGIPLAITLLRTLSGFHSGLLDLLGALVLFSQPYFLFRLLQYYRPSRRWLHAIILLSMVLCWVILIIFIARNPATTQVIVFGYCVIVDTFCTWQYSRGIDNSTGILRRRLLLITISAGLFTLALAGNVAKAILPDLAQNISAIGLAITALSAILNYIAFIPPRWLRHAWQFEQLRDFLTQTNSKNVSGISIAESIQHLFLAARQAVNGTMGAVVQREQGTGQWTILGSTDEPLVSKMLLNGYPVIENACQRRQSISIYIPDMQEIEKRRQMEAIGPRTWLIVPIQATQSVWGMLLVTLRDRSLFIDDDIKLLELFAQQSAILLENSRLIAELQSYSEQLERKVEERTKELSESEAALRELATTLEQRVEQRTAELQRSNGELDQFAYVASHDLKAPLRAINHLASWIAQDAADFLPAPSQEHLAKLQGRVSRMETLLNDLLAYSRVGRQHHPVELVDITELIHSVTDILAPPPGFTVEVQGELPIMFVERTPLETVFRNLIGNAIKHHHRPSQGCVEIRAREREGFVEFIITDDGQGIAPEFHHRIFEIFQTLQPRDQLEGSGIGLAIVKKSVQSRGGTVHVESDQGKGATFRFTWPKIATTTQIAS